MTEFWKSSYWDKRFKEEIEFEWLVSPDLFVSQTHLYLSDLSTKAIAHIGCGNSLLSRRIQCMRDDVRIHNVDYSEEAINRARELNGEQQQLYHKANLLDTQQMTAALLQPVDLVVDKCVADSLSTGEDVVIEGTPRRPAYALAYNLSRVVKSGGLWICCSFSPYRFEDLAECAEWEITNRWSIPVQSGSEKDSDGRVVHRPAVHHYFIVLRRI